MTNRADQPHKLWFRAKTYGWGWTPITWQGWALQVIYVVVLTSLAFLMLPYNKGDSVDTVKLVALILFAFSATLIVIGISIQKGEVPRWQWGRNDGQGDSK